MSSSWIVSDSPSPPSSSSGWVVSDSPDHPSQYEQDIANRPGVPGVPVPARLQGPPEPERSVARQFGSGVFHGLTDPVLHPLQTLENTPSIGATPTPMVTGENAQAVQSAQSQGVHEQAEKLDEQLQDTIAHPAAAAGQLVGNAILAKGISKIPGAVEWSAGARERFRPKTSTAVVPATEQNARALAQTFAPPANEAENLVQALNSETGNIKEFAQRTGNPLNTQQEFQRAAKGAADEAKNHFEEKFLNPNKDMQVSTPPEYQGKTIGEGRRATIDQINDRIEKINKLLRPDYSKRTPGQVQSALANEAELRAEGESLTNLLNSSLAKATGIPVEDVAKLRQRYGKLYSIAGEGQASVNQRATSAQKASEGRRDIPISTAGAVAEGINKLRGGPQSIADRMMQKALQNPFSEAYPLPEPNPPAVAPSTRVPLAVAAQIEPTSPSADIQTTPIDQIEQNTNRFQARREGVLNARQQAEQQAEANRIAAQNEFQRQQELQEQAQQSAKERSEVARQARSVRQGVHPSTHQFSKSAWQAANPNGNAELAAEHARNEGFDVVD